MTPNIRDKAARAELLALHKKASHGEWGVDENFGSLIADTGDGRLFELGDTDMDGESQHLACEAVNVLPAALAYIAELETKLAAASELIDAVGALRRDWTVDGHAKTHNETRVCAALAAYDDAAVPR